jgi:Kef-type K+ transport system membrane component KefB
VADVTGALAFWGLKAPEGPAWEFLVLFVVVVLGPRIVERARIPGIVGLLLGGYLIGPHGFGFIGAGNETVPDLGQLGLLYLMFVAGVELDLAQARRHRTSTLVFGGITFAIPMAAGTAVGLALDWDTPAAILLGSLVASHTLITYPLVQKAGLAGDPAVATAVGATVLTDTVTLVILAGVSGSETGEGNAATIALRLIVGLAALTAFAFGVLPPVARWLLRSFGADRAVRYLVAVCGFLSAATVAEIFGIEGIVGAFAAGLALNRLVPNDGPLMERISFFGSAVFVPVFLVSVGLVLEPAVMVEARTLGYAALIILASTGGKALASAIGARLLGFTPTEGWLMFALTAPQAAATLAATTVGYEIGLFSSSVVNAVLILILVSIVVATLVADRMLPSIPRAEETERPLGARVLVAVDHTDPSVGAFALAGALAGPDGGAVDTILVSTQGPMHPGRNDLEALDVLAAQAGVDGSAALRVDRSFAHAVVDAAASARASAVVVVEPDLSPDACSAWADAVDIENDTEPPVILVRGSDAPSVRSARLVAPPEDVPGDVRQLAAQVAARLGVTATPPDAAGDGAAGDGDGAGPHDGGPHDGAHDGDAPDPAEVTVIPVGSWSDLPALHTPPEGTLVVFVPPRPEQAEDEDDN